MAINAAFEISNTCLFILNCPDKKLMKKLLNVSGLTAPRHA